MASVQYSSSFKGDSSYETFVLSMKLMTIRQILALGNMNEL